MASPEYIESRIDSIRKNLRDDDAKTNVNSLREIKEEEVDPLEEYLRKLKEGKTSKESPLRHDDNAIEVNHHRKSGKSSSPIRQSAKISYSKYKESTNIPLTSSLSSEDYYGQNEQEEDIILEELNDLYSVFLGWVFSSKNELDCSRPIRYNMMLPLCLNLAAKSTRLMKQKAISDFNFMTAVEKNASIIMNERTFSRWMLDLLYTVFPPKMETDKDPIWEMGCKLYIQINKMCFNTDMDAHLYVHQLISWPINRIIQLRQRKDLYKNEVWKKERMVRTILYSFFDTLSADKERDKWGPTVSSETHYRTFWFN